MVKRTRSEQAPSEPEADDIDLTVPMDGVVVHGGRLEASGRTVLIGAQTVTIGRGRACTVQVTDKQVSLMHAALRATPDGVMLEDLASRNGTFVGSVLVREHNAVCLTEPCTIRAGGVRLRFVPGESGTQPIALGSRFGGLVGSTAQMRALFAELDRCAAGDLSVCIGGETGTGKELVARAIHDASARRRGPFVAISCADLAGYGLEDALFGRRRGAYTGADEDRAGAFVSANGGTLFFDEAAEMSLALQAKLLRVLETKEVQPLGSDEKRRVNVRTVFATNADLRSLLNSGKFRDDLYFRISQFDVTVPALRDRLGDLPLLIGDLLVELGRPEVSLDASALEVLTNRRWEGNVRELRSVLQRALMGFTGSVLYDSDVRGACRSAASSEPSVVGTYSEAIEQSERDYYTGLHRQYKGNISQMSRQADRDRATVRTAMKRFGLNETADASEPGGGWLKRLRASSKKRK